MKISREVKKKKYHKNMCNLKGNHIWMFLVLVLDGERKEK